MKNVVIVTPAPMFLEFLKDKLAEENIGLTVALEKYDAIVKMDSLLPELTVMDLNEQDSFTSIVRLLQKIKEDPNASRIPLIAVGPIRERNEIAVFAKYGLRKYFVKPIKFDVFFESIGHILHTTFSMDTTPCVLDLHRNGKIIFVEVAQGLNREKIQLLKYRLNEMIDTQQLTAPKVILMLSNLDLTFVDGLYIELLIDSLLSNQQVHVQNIKILSFSAFVKELIAGHENYNGIEVSTDLSSVLNSIMGGAANSQVQELISDNILASSETAADGSIEIRFSSDVGGAGKQVANAAGANQKPCVALVDDDIVSTNLLASAFRAANFDCLCYTTGTQFIADFNRHTYNVIILDIMMPGISGFDTLNRLKALPSAPPVIVYSQGLQREWVIQALSCGAKHYFIKPQKPALLVEKARELINANG